MRHPRRRPRGSVPAPDSWSGAVTLLAVAERGCALQDRAEAVLAVASLPTATRDSALAREGGRLAGEYHRLAAWVADTAVADSLHQAHQQELDRLLRYHCQVLHHGIRMAFPRHGTPGVEHRAGRHISAGLGEPARRLRELAEELRLAL